MTEPELAFADLNDDMACTVIKNYHVTVWYSSHKYDTANEPHVMVQDRCKAIHVALKKLEEGCNVEDAMVVCDPGVLDQIMKWKISEGQIGMAMSCQGTTTSYRGVGKGNRRVGKKQRISNNDLKAKGIKALFLVQS
ncbi:hypothetical protein Tco_0615391 [Tanacetum coccineum]